MDLVGKTAIVTGANSGMGMATVEALSDKGARVIMVCRNKERGQKAYHQLTAGKNRDIRLMFCDLADFDSIRSFVKQFMEENDRLDILINNAGFISLNRQETKNGLERQIGINYFGHFLLTMLLQKMMKAGGRIVIVASGAHKAGKIHFDDINLTRGYNVVNAYGQSKLAEVLFARLLSEKLKDRGITVNCCHPGAVATNMGVDRETGFGKTITGMLKPFFLTPAEGCATAVFLATDDSVADVTGEYFYKCKIAKSSKRSKDMKAAKRLFWLSCEITGL